MKHIMTCFLFAIQFFFLVHANAETLTPYAILQGVTGPSNAQFGILAPAEDQVRVEVRETSGEAVPAQVQVFTSPDGKWQMTQVFANALSSEKKYQLIARSKDGLVEDIRNFQPIHDRPGSPLRVAVLSCLSDLVHNPFAWKRLRESNPELVIITGDAVYLDRASFLDKKAPENKNEIWKRHVRTRWNLDMGRWVDLKPYLTGVDDHDFGFDGARSDWKLKTESREVYEIFFPRREVAGVFEHGPGLSGSYKIRGQQFIIMDGRTFQSPEQDGAMFNDEQIDWLTLKATQANVFLVSGSQFFGAYLKKDSFQYNHPNAFKRFLNKLKDHTSRFVFISGDIHFSELMKIPSSVLGYPTYEVTSSSMHSATFPGRHKILEWLGKVNPWRVGATSTHNFAVMNIQPPEVNGSVSFDLAFQTWRGKNVFQSECSDLLTKEKP